MKFSDKKTFYRILISYLSVLIIPILIGTLIYYSAVSSTTKMVRNYSHSMLNQSINTIDAQLKELESIPFYLSSLSELTTKNVEIPPGSSKVYDIYQLYQHIPKFSLTNNLISNTQIILLNNEFILTDYNALRITPQTYSGLLSYTGMDLSEFWTFAKGNIYDNEFVQFTDAQGNITPVIINSITDKQARFPQALVIIQLKKDSLKNTMSDLLIDSGSRVFLLDQNNNLITSAQGKDAILSLEDTLAYLKEHPEEDADYKNDIVTTIKSDYNDWRYCIFSPKEAVMAGLAATKQRVILLTTISLIISFLFTAFLCMRKAAVLKQVVAYLSGDEPEISASNNNEFSYVINAASKLKTNNKELTQNMLSQKPLLDATVLRNAFSGTINKPEELQYLFSTLDIQPDNQHFAVLLIHAKPINEAAQSELTKYPVLLAALVRECIEKNAPCPVYSLDIDNRQKVVLLIGNSVEKQNFWQQLVQFAENTREMSLQKNSIILNFCASDIYDMVDDLPRAYNQAIVISQQATRKQGCYFFTSTDIPEIQKLYYYPIQTELELVRLIKTGSQNDLSHLLDTIRNNNLVERTLSSSMLSQLTFSIRSSIIRGLADLPQEQLSSDAYLTIHKMNDPALDTLFPAILELNKYLVHVNNQLNSSKNERQAEKIMEYISSHYACSDFTIYTICDEFHISESFAYQIFREVIGTSFADILEQIRIEQACQMLSEGKYLIKDIALHVGYTNDNSFRRAFKRVMGVTPGEFASS